jgi:hypothetical protein
MIDRTGEMYLSTRNWPTEVKAQFVYSFFVLTLLVVCWIFLYLWNLYTSFSYLQRVPYSKTRYAQLSFRFFLLEAFCVALFYVIRFVGLATFTFMEVNDSIGDIAESLNQSLKLDISQAGKTVFVSVYALILAFIYLPADTYQDSNVMRALNIAFVLRRSDIESVRIGRKAAIEYLSLNTGGLMSIMLDIPEDVFCAELALWLSKFANEAYYDAPDLETRSACGPMLLGNITMLDLSPNVDNNVLKERSDSRRLKVELLHTFYQDGKQTFGALFRDIEQKSLILSFRGTNCKDQWQTNLNYRFVDVHDMIVHGEGLEIVDGKDGLDVVYRRHIELRRLSSDVKSDDPESTWSFANLRRAYKFAKDFGLSLSSGIARAATTKHFTGKVKLHGGFWLAYSEIRQDVQRVLREKCLEFPDHGIYFTGHSLGGALASLAAADFEINSAPRINAFITEPGSERDDPPRNNVYANKPVKTCLYTFGAPRVGNSAWQILVDRKITNYFRCVIWSDIVTDSPPKSIGFAHPGQRVQLEFSANGSLSINPSFLEKQMRSKVHRTVAARHLLSSYIKSVSGVIHAALFLEEVKKEGWRSSQQRTSFSLYEDAARAGMDAKESFGRPSRDFRPSERIVDDLNFEDVGAFVDDKRRSTQSESRRTDDDLKALKQQQRKEFEDENCSHVGILPGRERIEQTTAFMVALQDAAQERDRRTLDISKSKFLQQIVSSVPKLKQIRLPKLKHLGQRQADSKEDIESQNSFPAVLEPPVPSSTSKKITPVPFTDDGITPSPLHSSKSGGRTRGSSNSSL